MGDGWLFVYGFVVLLLGLAGWIYTIWEVTHFDDGSKGPKKG